MNQILSQQLLLIKTAVILPLEGGFLCNCPYSLKSAGLRTLLSFMEGQFKHSPQQWT